MPSFILCVYVVCTIGCIIHLSRKESSSELESYKIAFRIIVGWAICPTFLAVLYCLNTIVNSRLYKTFTDVFTILLIAVFVIGTLCGGVLSLLEKIRKGKSGKH